jgi:hypothetical protein
MGLQSEQSEGQEYNKSSLRSEDGCDGVSRFKGHNNISDWLARKDEKKLKPIAKNVSRRTGLSRGGQLKRTPLNKVSKKQKKKNGDYAKAKKEFYKEDDNRKCYCCGCDNNLSIHHIKKRSDGNISNKETFVTLCLTGNYMDAQYPEANHSHSGGCHGFIEGNKSIARELGLLE